MDTPLYSTLPVFTLWKIRNKLRDSGNRLALAESCTSGLAAAELGRIPGISEFFCGSQVVYQTESKTAWLGIDSIGLAEEDKGPVSRWASEQLTLALLQHTPKATVAAAVTGHLGPGAPPERDGAVFVSLRFRSGETANAAFQLVTEKPAGPEDWQRRSSRQQEATARFLEWIEAQLPSPGPISGDF
ncbi:CinA family protein [Pirellulaceae bacterium SH501]